MFFGLIFFFFLDHLNQVPSANNQCFQDFFFLWHLELQLCSSRKCPAAAVLGMWLGMSVELSWEQRPMASPMKCFFIICCKLYGQETQQRAPWISPKTGWGGPGTSPDSWGFNLTLQFAKLPRLLPFKVACLFSTPQKYRYSFSFLHRTIQRFHWRISVNISFWWGLQTKDCL